MDKAVAGAWASDGDGQVKKEKTNQTQKSYQMQTINLSVLAIENHIASHCEWSRALAPLCSVRSLRHEVQLKKQKKKTNSRREKKKGTYTHAHT